MRRTIIGILAALLLVTGPAAFAEEIKVGGGGTPIDAILKPVQEPFGKTTGIQVNLVFSSATLAFKALMNGEVDASTAGLPYEDMLNALKKDKIDVADPAAYTAVTIGKGNIYVVLNKNNPVAKLSKDQIKGLFTGQIANWKDVGGADSPVILVISKINPATNGAFQKMAMDGAPYATDVLDAGKFEDVRDKVAANVEAVAFGPVTMLDDTIKKAETPEFSRPITLFTKGKPSAKVQKLIDYIKGEGQKYVKQ